MPINSGREALSVISKNRVSKFKVCRPLVYFKINFSNGSRTNVAWLDGDSFLTTCVATNGETLCCRLQERFHL